MPATHAQPHNIIVAERDFTWADDLKLIVDIVARHFSDFNGNGFYPHPDEVAPCRR